MPNVISERLFELYKRLLSRAAGLPSHLLERGEGGLGCPFLLLPCDGWQQAKHRILVIGKEPNNWGFPNCEEMERCWLHPELWWLRQAIEYRHSVEALTWAYNFPYPGKPTLFNGAVDRLRSHARGSEAVSTNLFRCALINGKSRSPLNGSASDLTQIQDWQHGCLTEEIGILDPNTVVFFTGPDYDDALRNEFKGAELIAVEDHPVRELAWVVHERLTSRSIRTYHPEYFLRYNKYKYGMPFIDEIASLVKVTTHGGFIVTYNA